MGISMTIEEYKKTSTTENLYMKIRSIRQGNFMDILSIIMISTYLGRNDLITGGKNGY